MNVRSVGGSGDIARMIAQSTERARKIIPKTEATVDDAKRRGGNAIRAVLSSSLISGGTGSGLNIKV